MESYIRTLLQLMFLKILLHKKTYTGFINVQNDQYFAHLQNQFLQFWSKDFIYEFISLYKVYLCNIAL